MVDELAWPFLPIFKTPVMQKLPDCRTFTFSIAFLLLFSQGSMAQKNSSGLGNIIEEVRKVEKQFESDLNQFGAAMAFEKYAASDAVIRRYNDSLIYGPKAIKEFYSAENFKNAKASWPPTILAPPPMAPLHIPTANINGRPPLHPVKLKMSMEFFIQSGASRKMEVGSMCGIKN